VSKQGLAVRDAIRLTSIAAGGGQELENLLVVEMLERIDVVEELGRELVLARMPGRRGDALCDAAQGRGALETAAGSFEAVALLRGAKLVQLRLVGLHGVQVRAEASIMPEIGGSRAVLGGQSCCRYEREADAREMEAFEKLLTIDRWV